MAFSSAKIVNCLFFESQAEEAAKFYISVFPDSSIQDITRFPDTAQEVHKQPAGSVMVVNFTLNGQGFTALNSKPAEIKFNESISFQIMCDSQEEVDHYWGKLSEGGDEAKQMCGWLCDKYGVSWQVVPKKLAGIMATGDPVKAKRGMNAFMKMKKIIIKDLLEAVETQNEGEGDA